MTEDAGDSTIADMATKIRRGARLHLYIAEWRENRGLSIETLAGKLDVDRTTAWRLETGRRRPTPGRTAQIAKALDIEPADLWRPPDSRPSLDAMARGVPDDVFQTVVDIVQRLTRRAS